MLCPLQLPSLLKTVLKTAHSFHSVLSVPLEWLELRRVQYLVLSRMGLNRDTLTLVVIPKLNGHFFFFEVGIEHRALRILVSGCKASTPEQPAILKTTLIISGSHLTLAWHYHLTSGWNEKIKMFTQIAFYVDVVITALSYTDGKNRTEMAQQLRVFLFRGLEFSS